MVRQFLIVMGLSAKSQATLHKRTDLFPNNLVRRAHEPLTPYPPETPVSIVKRPAQSGIEQTMSVRFVERLTELGKSSSLLGFPFKIQDFQLLCGRHVGEGIDCLVCSEFIEL